MSEVYFMTGTSTDVGKTYVSCRLLKQAQEQGLSTLGLKPVAAGATNGKNEDAIKLREYSSVQLPYQRHNPICFTEPAAPHILAQKAKQEIKFNQIVKTVGDELGQADFTIIEGAGGWSVPINSNKTMADLARALNVPIILVVAMRLGCLNHALLTAQAIKQSGCQLHSWIANPIDGPMDFMAENIESLRNRIEAPLNKDLLLNGSVTR